MAGQRMRYLSIIFGLALMVIVGGIVAVVATQQPAPVAPGTPAAGGSPLPTATLAPITDSPSPLPPIDSPSPGISPDAATASPLVSPEASPSPDASPDPTPSPAATPGGPMREVAFIDLGLDNSGGPDELTTPRYITFSAEGPGMIRVHLSRVTARVRACLWQGDRESVSLQRCRTLRRGDLERELAGGTGAQDWTLSLIGADVSGSPSVTVRITFPTNDPQVTLEGFRFQGHAIEGYNGFTAELRAASGGDLVVDATFDDGEGGSHPYRLVVQQVGGGPAQPFLAEGEGTSLAERTALTAERTYQVTLENREEVSEQAVMLRAELDWP